MRPPGVGAQPGPQLEPIHEGGEEGRVVHGDHAGFVGPARERRERRRFVVGDEPDGHLRFALAPLGDACLRFAPQHLEDEPAPADPGH